MRCSSCSSEVRPIVVWDIDGTMANYHDTFPDFCASYFDRDDMPERWDGSGEMEDYLGLTKEQYREAKLAYRQGGNKRWLPVYDYAQYAVNAMHRDGAEVWLATTRPWQLLSNIDPDTKEWLRRNSIPYDGLLYGDDKYDRLVESVDPERVLIVIEDLPDLVDRAIELGLPAFQVHRDHNLANRREGGTLPEALELYWERSDNWKEAHGR